MIRDILVRTATYDLLREQSCCESAQIRTHKTEYSNIRNVIGGELYFENETTYSQATEPISFLLWGKLFDLSEKL
jgi:hypothetical protein